MPETHSSISPRCLKCGSDAIVPDVLFLEKTNEGSRKPVELAVQRKPQAWIRKGEVSQLTQAQVCGECGFVELYAPAPAALWDAYIDRLANDL